MIRKIIQTENGPALIQDSHEGVVTTVVGQKEVAELVATDEQWAEAHKQLQTGKLKFDTVKKTLGKSEQATQ